MRAALPTLTLDALSSTLGDRSTAPLGYATAAIVTPGGVGVVHHRSTIARLSADRIVLDAHGYRSRTTAERLDKVLTDNATGFRAAIRQGVIRLLWADTLRPVSIVPSLDRVAFRRSEGQWILTETGA